MCLLSVKAEGIGRWLLAPLSANATSSEGAFLTITVIFQEARRPLLLKWSGLWMIIRQGPWSQSLYSAVQFQARTCPLWEPRTILVWVPGPLGIVSYVDGNGHSPGDTWTRTQKKTSQMPSQQSASLSTMLSSPDFPLTIVLSPSVLHTLRPELQKAPHREGAAYIATSRGQHRATHSWSNNGGP